MLKIASGIFIGIIISVLYYDFGITPIDLIDIVVKNGQDVVEEVQAKQTVEQLNSRSLLSKENFM